MSKLTRHQISEIIAKRSTENISATKLAEQIAAYLISERRSSELQSILRDIRQFRENQGIVEVDAYSAHKLSDQARRDIEAQVRELYPSATQIIINEIRDESVIGSIKLELANQQFDASLRVKLNRFKQLTGVKG